MHHNSDMIFDDPLVLLGMYIACLGPIGFLFGVCSDCCTNECLQFEDDFEIKAGRKVSWPNNTAAFDLGLNPVTLSANTGMVLSLHDFGGFLYALVEYEDGGTQQAYILVSDLTKEIDDWWEVCSGGWEIDGSTLTSTSAGTMTFLITEPTPYGIFTAEIEGVVGVEYRMFIRRGVDSEDECGADDLTIRWEWTGFGEFKITVGDEDPIFRAAGAQDPPVVRIGVCIDEKGVTVIFDNAAGGLEPAAGRQFQVCSLPTGYYFAIGASAAGSRWNDVCYSDHYDHNPACPRCQPSCCFPNVSETVSGYDITVTGIGPGIEDCDCGVIEAFVPLQVNGLCLCTVGGTVESSYPGGGFGVCQAGTDITVTLECTTEGILLNLSLLPGANDTSVVFSKSFAPGTLPEDVKMTAEPVQTVNQGTICDYTNAVVTMTPRVTTGCCGGEPEEENPLP